MVEMVHAAQAPLLEAALKQALENSTAMRR
jgi:hypothetical protein